MVIISGAPSNVTDYADDLIFDRATTRRRPLARKPMIKSFDIAPKARSMDGRTQGAKLLGPPKALHRFDSRANFFALTPRSITEVGISTFGQNRIGENRIEPS